MLYLFEESIIAVDMFLNLSTTNSSEALELLDNLWPAIIGVLVAISVPIFSQQLHKARVATDWANVRNYYSQLQYDFMETETVKDEYLNVWGKPGITSFN